MDSGVGIFLITPMLTFTVPEERVRYQEINMTVTKKLLPLQISNYTICAGQGICRDNRWNTAVSPSFLDFDQNRKGNHDSETPNKSTEHEDIAVVCVGGKSKELQGVWSKG